MGHTTESRGETGETERNASFIIRVRHQRRVLQITLQDVRTRRILHFGSWEGLFAELQRSSGERPAATLAVPPPAATRGNS